MTDTQPCVNPSHFAAPHHHGERGQAVQHRIEGCPWECGETVYAGDREQQVAHLRERAAWNASLGTPHWDREAQRQMARADRIEAGEARTAEDFVDDYDTDERRLHTTDMYEALVEHARKWEAEVRADERAKMKEAS